MSWVVAELKDERRSVASRTNRAKLFGEKAKYITSDTAFFVMCDPDMLVVSGIGLGDQADVEIPLAGLTIETFADQMAALRAEIAGVPEMLREFRDGNEALIARDKLTANGENDPSALVAIQINRNVFFDTLIETTRLMQRATLHALDTIGRERNQILEHVAIFDAKYGGHKFRAYPISIEGKERSGREQEQAHTKRLSIASPLPRRATRTGPSNA